MERGAISEFTNYFLADDLHIFNIATFQRLYKGGKIGECFGFLGKFCKHGKHQKCSQEDHCANKDVFRFKISHMLPEINNDYSYFLTLCLIYYYSKNALLCRIMLLLSWETVHTDPTKSDRCNHPPPWLDTEAHWLRDSVAQRAPYFPYQR